MIRPPHVKVGVFFFVLFFNRLLFAQFPNITTNNLDGITGFKIEGVAKEDRPGASVSDVGDINGDGIDDIIIGAPGLDRGSAIDVGGAYVIFGNASGFGASMAVTSLNGTNGFRLYGIDAGDLCGLQVSAAGDINGDGIDDMLIGAPQAKLSGFPVGAVYVVFGRTGAFPASINLSSLNGTNGFTIVGSGSDRELGIGLSDAGDVNGDGFDDIIIGAFARSVFSDPGRVYVVFGTDTGFTASLNVSSLNGTNGFRVLGAGTLNNMGFAVSGAGDVNGDNIDDMVMGSYNQEVGGRRNAGQSYVLFGRDTGFPASLSVSSLDGTNGFTLNGVSETGFSGFSVSDAGDVNSDGLGDIIIGAPAAGSFRTGISYVVFGSSVGFPAVLSLSSLNGTNGFDINGGFNAPFNGYSVSGAGDFNGDNIDDIITGSPARFANSEPNAGSIELVFGADSSFPSAINVPASLNGLNGFQLTNDFGGTPSTRNDWFGASVSRAGDINNDGIEDIIVGVHESYNPSIFDPTEVQLKDCYVVYGNAAPVITALTPADDAAGLLFVAEINLWFSENVFPGSGTITIRRSSDNSLIESIAIGSGQVAFNNDRVTVTLTVPLTEPGGYYVQFTGFAIVDERGVSAERINDNTTWNFTIANAFATTWQTANGAVTIPTTGAGYNYNIRWVNQTNPGAGDGIATGQTGDYTMTGLTNGDIYKVSIAGDFPRIYFNNGSQSTKIRTIEQWGDIQWASMESAFEGCSNLTYNATDAPDLSNVQDLGSMFREASNFDGDLSGWNTGNVRNMTSMFNRATNFNGDITTWNTGNVTTMRGMFDRAVNFNSDISNWNVENVTNLGFMFSNAGRFNADLSGWNVGNVTDMEGMFIDATGFNHSLGNWNIASATNLSRMLDGSGIDISNYDNTLIAWAGKTVQSGTMLGASGLYYTTGAQAERQRLINNSGWTINGDIFCGPIPDVTALPDIEASCEVTTFTAPTGTSCLGNVTVSNDASLPLTTIGTTVVIWTYTDPMGNQAFQEQNVVINDVTAPTAVTQNMTVQLDVMGNASITPAEINNGSSDNCSIQSLSLDQTIFNCTDLGDNTITLTAIDGSGNTGTAMATVTVEDNINPTALARDITIQLDAAGNATITPDQVDNRSSDNCGTISLALDQMTFTCDDLGNNTVTLTVTDNSGNRSQATAMVTVEDTIQPLITCPADIVSVHSMVEYPLPQSTDNCSIQSIQLMAGFESGNDFPPGTTTVQYEITDLAGNTANCSFNVTVNSPPTDITLSNSSIIDHVATGFEVGMFSTIDADVDDSHTYALVSGDGDESNTLFKINGAMLLTNSIFDSEQQSSHNIRVSVSDSGGATFEKTFTIAVLPDSESTLDIVTGFTPDNDGVNDTWNIKNISRYPDASVRIYDRYGHEVFSSVGYDREWDGTRGGKSLPAGTYYYSIRLNDAKNQVFKGFVVILR